MGLFKSKQAIQINNDSRVFLVDVMQLFLESKLTDEVLAEAGIARGVRRELLQTGFTDIHRGGSVAWGLYHLGLMQTNPQ